MYLDQRRMNLDNPHAARHARADAERDVDVVHARHIPAGQDRLSDLGALLRIQGHAATGLTLLGLTRLTLLTLLGLARLSLPLGGWPC